MEPDAASNLAAALQQYNDEELFFELLNRLGYNPDENDHMQDTPERFVRMLRLATQKDESWEFTTFESTSDEMVIVQNIPFYTFCAHHLIPFFGKAHVAYLPAGKIVGLSKLARTVQYHSKGFNVQEELTTTQGFLMPLLRHRACVEPSWTPLRGREQNS
jgi:GTP cyclohydrolase I